MNKSKTARLLNIIQLSSGVCFIRQERCISTEPICICGCSESSDGEGLGPVTDAVGPSDDPSTVLDLTEESKSLSKSLSSSETATNINIVED